MKKIIVLMLMIVMAETVLAGYSQNLIIPISEDAFVADEFGNDNFGLSADMFVGSSDESIRRIYLKYDVSEATELNITNADIHLYADAFEDTEEFIDVHYVPTDSWNQQGGMNITWNNKPGYVSTATDSVNVTTRRTWYTFDVTNDVKFDIAMPDTVVSFLLKGNDESINNHGNFIRFWSQDYTTDELHPYLNITYWNESDPFINTPPEITDVSIPQTGEEGETIPISFTAEDIDENIESYEILVDGENIANDSAVDWIPNYEEAGEHTITIIVTDESDENDTQEHNITISNVQNFVINEFYSNESQGENEWVEIYNPFNESLQLTDWRVEQVAHFGGTFSAEIPPLGYLVVYSPNLGLVATGDIISLYDTDGILVDRVAYGTAMENNPDNAPAPPNGNSTGRIQDGVDTDVEVDDFQIYELPTPEDPNDSECIPQDADENCDGCIDTLELFDYISEWKVGHVTTLELFDSITKWKSGVGC
ncbi:DNRLRE domain-containing protein [Nanoarchaeota archaeon]